MEPDETPLAMVNRHVSEGEGHITSQVRLIERLRTSPATSGEAEAFLAEAEVMLTEFRLIQTAHLAHLQQIHADQKAGLRDANGNLELS